MMRRLVAWVLVIVLSVSFAAPAFANDKDDHDKVIKDVLFGENRAAFDGEQQKKLNYLLNAVAICLDQYNWKYKDELQELNDSGVRGIPESINEINFRGNEYHRMFTHKGWNYPYPDYYIETAHWDVRKNILFQTVKEVFSFRPRIKMVGFLKIEVEYNDQCDAFAAFLYYLHILGEYYVPGEEDKEHTEENSATMRVIIPLAVQHPGEGNEDVFWELERILPIVCKSSVKEEDYSGLEVVIKGLEQEARKLGDINDENIQQYRDIVTRLLEHLKSKVPGMLKKEPFFNKVFN